MRRPFVTVTLPVCLTILAAVAYFGVAGNLTPPGGPVAPTMKTLTEVEPRTAINATNTPGDADSLYKISQPGSYYLTGNVTGVSAKSGIEIAASDVTLDLRGFALLGAGGTLDGIRTDAARDRITIRNGLVQAWTGSDIDLMQGGTGNGSLIENIHAGPAGTLGIRCNNRGIIRSCSSDESIIAPSNGLIESCTVSGTTTGIVAAQGSIVRGCTSSQNSLSGFSVTDGCTVIDCTATGNAQDGIFADDGCTVRDCVASLNARAGIHVATDCRVLHNTVFDNDLGIGIGLVAAGARDVIESNYSVLNNFGIRIVPGSITAHVISDNTVMSNTDNYDFAPGTGTFSRLNIKLSELPESIDWAATVTLAGPIEGAGGITVSADDVTIDLGGSTIYSAGGALEGIRATGTLRNLRIKNGAIRGFDSGLVLPSVTQVRIEHVTVMDASIAGIQVGASAQIIACSTLETSNAITTGASSVVTDTTARRTGSPSNVGFTLGDGTIVSGCSASGFATAFSALTSCSFRDCVARLNVDGILTGDGSTVQNCTISGTGDAIRVSNDSVVMHNTSDGGGAFGVGIHATGSDNRIEENNCTDGARGLDLDSANNYVAGNTVRDNTVNYEFAPGNHLNLIISQLPQSIDWPANLTLAGDLIGVSAQNGLTINSDGVTIDLGGHGLIGVSGSMAGISVPAARKGLTVRNGRLVNWGGAGISAANADSSRFEELIISTNNTAGGAGSGGILGGNGCAFHHVIVEGNTGDGLLGGSTCTITDCVARSNSARGLAASSGAVVRDCTAILNGTIGINPDTNSLINHCVARSNTEDGIVGFTGSTISHCTAGRNTLNGIKVTSGVVVLDNSCQGNGSAGDGAGILATGSDNRIEGNNCIGADRGIDVDGTGNIIVRNTCSGNTTNNWDIVASNAVAPIVQATTNGVAITGNTYAGSLGNTDPNANFTYRKESKAHQRSIGSGPTE